MAQGFSAETVGVLDATVPASKSDGRVVNAKTRVFQATFDLSLAAVKKVNGDNNVCFDIPAGYKPLRGWTNQSVTLGSTTVAIGTVATPAKYKAAATSTAVDAPQEFMKSSASVLDPLAADERVTITWGAADAPGTGLVQVFMLASAR